MRKGGQLDETHKDREHTGASGDTTNRQAQGKPSREQRRSHAPRRTDRLTKKQTLREAKTRGRRPRTDLRPARHEREWTQRDTTRTTNKRYNAPTTAAHSAEPQTHDASGPPRHETKTSSGGPRMRDPSYDRGRAEQETGSRTASECERRHPQSLTRPRHSLPATHDPYAPQGPAGPTPGGHPRQTRTAQRQAETRREEAMRSSSSYAIP